MNAQLIDAESGAHLWADQFDTNRANLAEAQSEITGRLAWTLNIELLSDASRRIEHENAVDPDARDLVMRGWAWWYGPQSPKAAQEALRAFERALEIDPRSTDARIGIARILVAKLTTGWSSSSFQQMPCNKTSLEPNGCSSKPSRAIRTSQWLTQSLGFLRRTQSRLTESRIAFEKALTLDPNFEWANMQLGWTLHFWGEPAERLLSARKAYDSAHATRIYRIVMCYWAAANWSRTTWTRR